MALEIAPVIDLPELHSLMREDAPRPLRLLDVRWALDGSKGHHTYLAGHVPSAVYVDLPVELAAPPSPEAGRHPLPDPADFAAAMRRAGVSEDSVVVAYDDTNGSQASRLVWMLRTLGHEAALLSGGLSAWDGGFTREDERPRTGDLAERPWPRAAIADIEEVASGRALVIDARAPERYRGQSEPIDQRAGHVPGAVNLPLSGNLDEDGHFLSPEQLRERFTAAGARKDAEVIVYCGSGVTATHEALALQRAGFSRVRLFPGSWSQWSADPSRPVATGQEP